MSNNTVRSMYYPKQVAELLNVSERTVERYVADEIMRVRLGAKKIRGRWRFIRHRVDAYITSFAN